MPLMRCRRFSATRSPESSTRMSPRTRPRSWPLRTASPSLQRKVTSVRSSSRVNTRANTSSPAMTPSCLASSSTSPGVPSRMTAFVLTSSFEISSRSAASSSGSICAFIVMGFILFPSFPLRSSEERKPVSSISAAASPCQAGIKKAPREGNPSQGAQPIAKLALGELGRATGGLQAVLLSF